MAEDRTPLGVVEEVFGPVTQPLYAFRWGWGVGKRGKGSRCIGGVFACDANIRKPGAATMSEG